jgi:hypothetical protein
MLQIRNLTNLGHVVSTNPLVDGPHTVQVNVNINLSSGAGNFWGALEIRPTALAGQGTWVGSFAGHLKGGRLAGDPLTLVDARIVVHGTGALDGSKLMFDHLINPAFEAPAGPVGCTFNGEVWSGVILDPRS